MKRFSNTFFKYFTCGSIGCEITSNYSFYISTYSLLISTYEITYQRNVVICQLWIVWQNIYLLLCYKHWLIILVVGKLNVVIIKHMDWIRPTFVIILCYISDFLADFPQDIYDSKQSKTTLALIPYQVQFNVRFKDGSKYKPIIK